MYSKVSEDGKNVVLSNGTNHPIIGFGTYKIGFVPASSNTAGNAVAAGYRYFDCAQFYGNEAMVGAALKDCGVPRAELFLVSKVWGDKMFEGKDAILAQLETTLTDLQTDYLDAYLIHWPIPAGKHVEAYKVLEGAYDAKKIRAIGLSNYTVEDYLELEAANIRIPPVVNQQIEVNPFLYRPKTLAFFAGKNVAIQSYRALRQETPNPES
ncbi:NADP-dependent oxidoreductase domain-containing protein [Baffinella frigidus]|nr:NADP-dependent oxidoreductase domain-containing protein [Cryptophyta sp. CCMP2293]